MGASDKIEGPASQRGKSEKVWQKKKESSSQLLFGLIFLLVIVFLLAVIALGVMYLVPSLLGQPNGQYEYSPGGMPASPTIIVRPTVAPNMDMQEKLDATDPIVGQWKSCDIELKYYTYPRVADSFFLTVYNDNTFIIQDKVNETYIVGTWAIVSSDAYSNEYSGVEPGKAGPFTIVGHPESLQFQYKTEGYISYLRR